MKGRTQIQECPRTDFCEQRGSDEKLVKTALLLTCDLHCSSNVISVIKVMEGEMGGTCSTSGRKSRTELSPKTERKRPLGNPRRRWEDNIKTGLSSSRA
jgi:hypothetical protein